MLIAITRLKLKSVWMFFPFIAEVHKVRVHTQKAKGNKFISLRRTSGGYYWTVTAWENMEAMWEFRNDSIHRKVMNSTGKFTSRVDSTHFESDKIPSWNEAISILETSLKKKAGLKEKIILKIQ